ncbi:MAG: hypothetical protein H2057_03730 [Alphaproteobacteria bacterium]|nr:hypothetical protein [Alphaproteobacteria bacterium]
MRHRQSSITLCLVGTLMFSSLEASTLKEERVCSIKTMRTNPVFNLDEITKARNVLRDHTIELPLTEEPATATELKQPTLKDLFLAEVANGVELNPIPCEQEARPSLLSPLVQKQVRAFISPTLDASLESVEALRLRGVQDIRNAEQLLGSERIFLQKLESFSEFLKNKALQEAFLTSSKKRLSTQLRTELATFIKTKSELEKKVAVDLMEEGTLAFVIETQKEQVNEQQDNLNLLKEAQQLSNKERTLLLKEKSHINQTLQHTHEKKEILLKRLILEPSPLTPLEGRHITNLSQTLEDMGRDCLEDALKDPEISDLLGRGFKIEVNSRTGLELHQPVEQPAPPPVSRWSFNPLARFFGTPTTLTPLATQASESMMDLRSYSAIEKKLALISACHGWTPLKSSPSTEIQQEKASTIAATSSAPITIQRRQETSEDESTSPSLQARSPLSGAQSFTPDASLDLSMMGSMIVLEPEILSYSSSPSVKEIAGMKMSSAPHSTMGIPCGSQSSNGVMGPASPRRLL